MVKIKDVADAAGVSTATVSEAPAFVDSLEPPQATRARAATNSKSNRALRTFISFIFSSFSPRPIAGTATYWPVMRFVALPDKEGRLPLG